jgi:hypothetical protein
MCRAQTPKGEGIEIFYGPVVHSPTHPDGDGLGGENRALYFSDPSGNAIEINCGMAPMDPDTNRVDGGLTCKAS